MMENTSVFIDGAYLSKIVDHFFEKRPSFRIDKLASELAKRENLWCDSIHYYTAPPYQSPTPTPEEIKKKGGYDKFVYCLRQIPHFYVHEGRCQKLDDGFHQKGVDTLLTMGLMSATTDGDYREIILLACDTDFVPILNKIRRDYKIKVILYYYSDFVRKSRFSMSNYLLTACDKKVLLTKEYFHDGILVK